MSAMQTGARVADIGWNPACPCDHQTAGGYGRMRAYLARVGVAVFGLLFAFAVLAERPAAGRALVTTSDPPPQHEVARTVVAHVAVAGVEAAPSPTVVAAPPAAAPP